MGFSLRTVYKDPAFKKRGHAGFVKHQKKSRAQMGAASGNSGSPV